MVQWVEVRSPTRLAPVAHSAKIWGLRALEHAADRDLYGYWHGEEEGIGVEGLSAQDDPLGIHTVYRLDTPAALMELWKRVAPLALDYLAQYEMAQRMRL